MVGCEEKHGGEGSQHKTYDYYLQGGHDVRYRTQCTVPDFLCTVRYGIELVCTVFWCVRYFSGSEKKKNLKISSLQDGKK